MGQGSSVQKFNVGFALLSSNGSKCCSRSLGLYRPAVEFCRVVSENCVAGFFVRHGAGEEIEQVTVIRHGHTHAAMGPVATPDYIIGAVGDDSLNDIDHVAIIRRTGF